MRPVPPDELRLLGRGIKQLRRKHRLTQQELAKRCTIHYQFLGGIERGTENPTLDILGRIARALGVPLPELFSSSAPDEGNPAQIKKTADRGYPAMQRFRGGASLSHLPVS